MKSVENRTGPAIGRALPQEYSQQERLASRVFLSPAFRRRTACQVGFTEIITGRCNGAAGSNNTLTYLSGEVFLEEKIGRKRCGQMNPTGRPKKRRAEK